MPHDLQMGRLVEAVDTLKKNDENIYRTLSRISQEQSKQTALIGQFIKGMDEAKIATGKHDTRISDLEQSRAKAIGAAGVLGMIGGFLSGILGKHI